MSETTDSASPSGSVEPPAAVAEAIPEVAVRSPRSSKRKAAAEPETPGADPVDAADEPDAPVLSRKAARKKRKLEAAADEDGSKPGAAASAAASANKPNVRLPGVWVGNMVYKTSQDMLRDFFAKHGCPEVSRIHMPAGKRSGELNRGSAPGITGAGLKRRSFAYVDFPDEEAANKAVLASEQPLVGRKLLIKRSTDFAGRPEGAAASLPDGMTGLSKSARRIADRQKNPVGPTLFLGNLGFEATEDDIRQLFNRNARAAKQWAPKKPPAASDPKDADEDAASSASEDERKSAADARPTKGAGIRQIRMGTFEDSGKCKGWAFVDFLSPAQASLALLNARNHKLHGRELVVEYAGLDAVRRGGNPMPKASKSVTTAPRARAPVTARPPRPPRSEEAPSIAVAVPKPAVAPRGERQSGTGARGGPTGPRKKVRSGEALATAQRASTAIAADAVAAKKITFD